MRNPWILFSGSKLLICISALLPIALPLAAQTAPPLTPEWVKAAGGKQEFDVASVRQNLSNDKASSTFSLTNGNIYSTLGKDFAAAPNGGYISATNFALLRYIIFAYRLNGTQELALRFNHYSGLSSNVPVWVMSERYDIKARADDKSTSDQVRLMMQSLLQDRFKLAVHMETRQAPVFSLALKSPGKLGPQLHLHPADGNCVTATATPADGLPAVCGVIAHLAPSAQGRIKFGGRNVSMAMLADSLPTQTGMATLPRPVVDQTGLEGKFDFSLEWTPEDTSADAAIGESGANFRDALENQLGLKLIPTKGPVEILVIDHIERPSEN